MGGAEKLVVDLVPRLREKGHMVDVALFNGEETALMQTLRNEVPDVRIYKLGRGTYNPFYILKLVRIMRKYDIVHSHNSSPQLFSAIAGVLCSVELCSTEHTTSNRKRGWKWYAPIESWMYSRYAHTICISKIAEEKLREYMGGEWLNPQSDKYHRISTVNNGVDVEAIHRAQPDSKLLKLKEGRKAIVMVAGFREAKDQDTIVRALSLLDKQKIELWFAGVGTRMPLVQQLVESLGLQKRVHFLGMRTDIPGVLQAADYVVMSSHWEGLSLSNLEGMSAGKPFIASDVNGLREITKGYGILFPKGDAVALATIIRNLHDDSEYYHRVAKSCFERAKEFDINKMAEGYNNVYLALKNKDKKGK